MDLHLIHGSLALYPNVISIGLAVFAQLTDMTNTQTERYVDTQIALFATSIVYRRGSLNSYTAAGPGSPRLFYDAGSHFQITCVGV